jgi:hypothetical protein
VAKISKKPSAEDLKKQRQAGAHRPRSEHAPQQSTPAGGPPEGEESCWDGFENGAAGSPGVSPGCRQTDSILNPQLRLLIKYGLIEASLERHR